MQDAHKTQTQVHALLQCCNALTRILNVAALLNSECLVSTELNCFRKPHITTVTGFICPLQATGMEITHIRTYDSFKSLETRKRSESCFYPMLPTMREDRCLLQGPQASTVKVNVINISGVIQTGEKRSTQTKTCARTTSYTKNLTWPIPVFARSKAWHCGPLASWDCGFESNGRHGCPLRMCVVTQRSLRRTDPSSSEALPSACH